MLAFLFAELYWKNLIHLHLPAAPFWLEKPTDLVLAPEENGRMVCRSDGAPRPTVSWFINGEPFESEFLEIVPTGKTSITDVAVPFSLHPQLPHHSQT